MKKTNRTITVLSAFFVAVALILVLIHNGNASAKFTKETGRSVQIATPRFQEG